MISRVLVPMDDSEMAKKALEYALDVHSGAEITVLTVVGGPTPMLGESTKIALADDPREAAEDHATAVFEDARELAAEHDAEIRTQVELGHPVRRILEHAAEYDAVVIGSHGGTLAERLFIGNVAQKVVRRSPVPVTVVR